MFSLFGLAFCHPFDTSYLYQCVVSLTLPIKLFCFPIKRKKKERNEIDLL